MKTIQTLLIGCVLGASGVATALAHEVTSGAQVHLANTVVPQAEKSRAQELLAEGPSETKGITSVDILGALSLDGEFASSDGLSMRVRELVVEPGGIVAVHQHDNRPGVAYILEGEMTEHRSTEDSPMVKTAGSTAFEGSGVIHWWENTGRVPARALVVDIVKVE